MTSRSKESIRIRKPHVGDIDSIYALIREGASNGSVLERSKQEILEHLRDFWVAEVSGEVVGVVGLHFISAGMGEIRSLVVTRKWQGKGVGVKLIKRAIQDAKKYGIREVLVLARKADIYLKMGFEPRDKGSLPQKIWRDCIGCTKFPECDESAFVKRLA